MILQLFITILIKEVICIPYYSIPLGYFSNQNLPFGIETDVHIDTMLEVTSP